MITPATQFDPESARFGTSRSQKRLEDDRLLKGQGLYSDDRVTADAAWLVVVRSPYAHARIASIDVSAATSAPGVLSVLTIADLLADGLGHIPFPPLFKQASGEPMAAPLRTLLAGQTAYFAGHPVAAVVAVTREQAQDAAELVAVDYEELPCVVDPRKAIEADAPQIPAIDGCISRGSLSGDGSTIAGRVNAMLDPGLGWTRGTPGGTAALTGWISFKDQRPADPLSLLFFADAFPPALFDWLPEKIWLPTIELTVHVRGKPAPGPLRGVTRTRFLMDGYLEEDGELWDSDNRMVAQSRQLGMVFRP